MKSSYFEGRGFGKNPRVVYLTNQLPWPALSGGQVRESQLLARVGSSVDVELFVLTEHFERDTANASLAAEHCSNIRIFESTPYPSHSPPDDLPERVWRYSSRSFDLCLRELLTTDSVDLVHVEGYFLANHVPRSSDVPVVVAEENVEYQLDREHATMDVLRGAAWQQSRSMEREVWSSADRVLGVSKDDVEVISADIGHEKVGFAPNGCDHLARPSVRARSVGRSRATFVGNYSWAPSRDAALELVRDVWPSVVEVLPRARLTLVGAGIDTELLELVDACPGVEAVGEVDSVLTTLTESDVFVCPTRTGSGVKVKMLEALQVGCPVVCVSGALRGLPSSARDAVVVADDPSDLADATVRLMKRPAERDSMSEKGFDVIAEMPTWDHAGKILLEEWFAAIASHRSVR